ncbi:hypothetical protein NQZ68_002032 [Dissostichus eleginoides]|nr:hypothetical protein NQZ68_002032 [Dissostichus eleginoides]
MAMLGGVVQTTSDEHVYPVWPCGDETPQQGVLEEPDVKLNVGGSGRRHLGCNNTAKHRVKVKMGKEVEMRRP